jgi:hypothetical protein
MVAADRMVMGDGAAGRDQRVGGAGLDVAAIARSAARIAADVEGVIDSRPVWIDVREAHRNGSLAAGRLDERVFRRLAHGLWNDSKLSQVMAVSNVSWVTPFETVKRGQRGRFEKGTKPGPGRPKGLLNKFTGDLKEAFLQAAQAAGGVTSVNVV